MSDTLARLEKAGKDATAKPWGSRLSDNGCMMVTADITQRGFTEHIARSFISTNDTAFIALARNVWDERVAVVRAARELEQYNAEFMAEQKKRETFAWNGWGTKESPFVIKIRAALTALDAAVAGRDGAVGGGG